MRRVRSGVEVEERVGGLAVVDAVLVAESDDRVGESCSLLGGVDLFVDGGERVPAPVGVVVLDRFAEALQVGADQLGERDQQREVEGGEVEQALPEVVERAVGEAGEVVDRLAGELATCARASCSSEGPRCSPQQRLILRPEPHGQGWLRPGPGIVRLLSIGCVRVASGPVRNARFRPLRSREFGLQMSISGRWRCDAEAVGGQVESLWDEVLPIEVRALPEDLAALDGCCRDPALLAPIAQRWQRERRGGPRGAWGGRRSRWRRTCG